MRRGPKPVMRTAAELVADPNIKNPLREWLHDRGRTLIDLARETGIGYNNLQMWSLGYRPISDDGRRELAAALNLPEDQLPVR